MQRTWTAVPPVEPNAIPTAGWTAARSPPWNAPPILGLHTPAPAPVGPLSEVWGHWLWVPPSGQCLRCGGRGVIWGRG